MKNIKCLLVTAAVTFTAVAAKAQTVTPEIEKRAAAIVAKMTLEEKVSYLSGAAFLRCCWPTVPWDFATMRPTARCILRRC